MNDANTNAERYLAIWNETDAARRRALIAESWSKAATYIDPLMRGEGHEQINSWSRRCKAASQASASP